MLTSRHRRDLLEKGYTVVEWVMTEEEADQYRQQFEDWIRDNFDEGTFPDTWKSLVHKYKIGYFAPTWAARLKCKDVFAQVWGTSRLLTSVDAIAIGRPPESGVEPFCSEDTRWLHIDQTPRRQGLHSYQGAVYLEHAEEDDWTLEVLEGSHNQFAQFWNDHPNEYKESLETGEYLRLKPEHLQWFMDKGCKSRRVSVPKGGLVLWDSRQVHANANPVKGRKHPDRWRWMVILCMGPANWASEEDLKRKREAYDNMILTHHWPSQGVRLFPIDTEPNTPEKHPLTEMPEIARTLEARRLAGVEPYPAEREQGDVDVPLPKWHPDYTSE
ncbi:hypothetical protein BaRGS_00003870 [Batillaria attramentaria]|uniref:Phytanoyl-CoA dioxygenase family protein n=1 Tax=Batillaria attramentaria TaxID=370345 RepID=A0ABD0LZA2_9CAEN